MLSRISILSAKTKPFPAVVRLPIGMTSRFLIFSLLAAAVTTQAQSFDSSGNALLQGTYNYRQVVYGNFDTGGGIGRAITLTGTMTFDGKGSYSFTGTELDSTVSTGATTLTWNGAYSTAPSGQTRIDSPLFDQEYVYGSLSRGVFLGSSTEGQTNDVVVAVAQGSPGASASTLSGSYWVGAMNFATSDPTQTRDALLQISANGSGGITVTSAAGYVGAGSTVVNQTIAGFSYTLANGIGTLSFPSSTGNQSLVSGNKTLYVSPDGNFIAGGSSNGYDLFFGVKASTGTASNSMFQGTYYTAGVDQDNSDLANSGAYLDTFWGAETANGGGALILRHDRVAPFNSTSFDYTFDSAYSIQSNGSYDRSSFRYAVGGSGLGVIGIGKGPSLGLFMAVKAPDFSGSGVYINPLGVVNSASNAPFTAGLSNGELITIYGSGLASSTVVARSLPFPTTLGNVQVKINGKLAPIYFVSPTQVSVIVPYGTSTSSVFYAQTQVINNGVASNTVTSFMNTSAPGVFTVPAGGVGYGAILHANFTLVSKANPAKKGETILIYLTGLGDVSPTATEGTAGPSSPLSLATDQYIAVYIDGNQATTSYVGLAPGLAGLYQINVQVPTTATSGDVYLEIDGADAATAQVLIPVQ